MRIRLSTGAPRALAVAAAAAAVLLAQSPSRATADDAESWPTEVRATYKVLFNGFEIGEFRFQTSITAQGYTADSRAQLSALMGAFKWRGATQASGTVDNSGPKPADYNFNYKGNSKLGSVKMSFKGSSVADVALDPPRKPGNAKRRVPIEPHHLKEVLDPVSAVLALSHGSGDKPCGRTLSIFDGRQRFDLIFTFRRQERITETRPSGQPGVGIVCHVRYQPVAGHKPQDEDSTMADDANVEITLRPVPSANLFVPFHVSIPLLVGSVELRTERIEIVTSNRRQIALTN